MIFRKFILPALSGAGVLFAIFVVVKGSKPTPVAPPAAPPPESSFHEKVAGTGLVEASSQNIAVAANVPGVITHVFVKVGDRVQKGQPLFSLDDRTLLATQAEQEATRLQAQAKLHRLTENKGTRPELVAQAKALVAEAQANVDDAANQVKSITDLKDSRAVSQDEISRRNNTLKAAQAKLASASANLNSLENGTWAPDLEVARADLALANAQVEATKTALDLLVVKAPVAGEVLQMNARGGEYAQAGPLATPLVVFGDVDRLRVRVDVDENEAWRVRAGADAVGAMRGKGDTKFPLHFEYIEPYIVPKKSLTGESTERVDTRVLQVIYSFERGSLPIYVGQQLDVFINDAGVENGAASAKNAEPSAGAVR